MRWMKLEPIIQSEVSQKEKHQYSILTHIYGKESFAWVFLYEVAQSCPTLATPWIVAYQASPSMGFSRQEYWSGLPFPSPSFIVLSLILGL